MDGYLIGKYLGMFAKYVLPVLVIGWIAIKYGRSIYAFVKASADEMTNNVTWPKYSELQSSTLLVIFASIIFAVLIGVIDLLFKNVMGYIYG